MLAINMEVKRSILLFIVATLIEFSYADYCTLSCGKIHTLCAYTKGNKCEKLGYKLLESGLTENERTRIVDYHNKLRQRVAAGLETQGQPGPQPAAKYMANLTWDDEIAMIAQYWADQCKYSHDKCRDTPEETIGQNIAIQGFSAGIEYTKVETLIQLWYNEVKNVSRQTIFEPFSSGTSSTGAVIGHYTQLVWAKTTKVGCGAVKYFDGKFYRLYLVCNYGPSGNFNDEMIYEPVGANSSTSNLGTQSKSSNDTINNKHELQQQHRSNNQGIETLQQKQQQKLQQKLQQQLQQQLELQSQQQKPVKKTTEEENSPYGQLVEQKKNSCQCSTGFSKYVVNEVISTYQQNTNKFQMIKSDLRRV